MSSLLKFVLFSILIYAGIMLVSKQSPPRDLQAEADRAHRIVLDRTPGYGTRTFLPSGAMEHPEQNGITFICHRPRATR